MRTLFLAWQASDQTRAWFPVGRLDAETAESTYVFRYIKGALDAHQEAGFEPLLPFPHFDKRYSSETLFPLFKNRVIGANRKDFGEYLRWLDLDIRNADPIEILAVSGGARETDSFEVFPKIVKDADQTFACRFFLHGGRYISEAGKARLAELISGEKLHVTVELTNPTGTAIQLQTSDYQMIGWTPRYLVNDLLHAIQVHSKLGAQVVQVNRDGAPINQRILIELSGSLPEDFNPMSSAIFEPLVS